MVPVPCESCVIMVPVLCESVIMVPVSCESVIMVPVLSPV